MVQVVEDSCLKSIVSVFETPFRVLHFYFFPFLLHPYNDLFLAVINHFYPIDLIYFFRNLDLDQYQWLCFDSKMYHSLMVINACFVVPSFYLYLHIIYIPYLEHPLLEEIQIQKLLLMEMNLTFIDYTYLPQHSTSRFINCSLFD